MNYLMFLLPLLLVGCLDPLPESRIAQCDPPMMIVNGDCCIDRDVNGECDGEKKEAPLPEPKITVATVAPAPPEEKDIDVVIGPDDIQCGYLDGKLIISFRNLGEKTWQLNNDLAWGHPAHIENVQIYFNQYQMNKKAGAYRNGKLLFGPGPKFSDACTTPILAPGESVRCEFENVPLADPSYLDGTNEIKFHIPSMSERPTVEFTCEEHLN